MKAMKAATPVKKPMKAMKAMTTTPAKTAVKKNRKHEHDKDFPIRFRIASIEPLQWSEVEVKKIEQGPSKVWGHYIVELHVEAAEGHHLGLDPDTGEPSVFGPRICAPLRALMMKGPDKTVK